MIQQNEKPTDVRVSGAELYFLPVTTRMPLKFGAEVVTSVTCARVRLAVTDRSGKTAHGWGETPLSVQWAWPAKLDYRQRHKAMTAFCEKLARLWCDSAVWGHPLEVGTTINESQLAKIHRNSEHEMPVDGEMPWLAALICSSAYDLALHDAYGMLHGLPVYQTYNEKWMNRDLTSYFGSETSVDFSGKYPADFLSAEPGQTLPAWHLVGGLDPLDPAELDAQAPNDGYPVLLEDWIDRDGLDCLKIKLRGTDAEWDFERTVKVGEISLAKGVHHLSTDFNCTVHDPVYVTTILDRLKVERPEIYDLLLYVEQPFPYELDKYPIDVGTIAAQKPIFMDESAHDWRLVREGHRLNWNGVALKTCKTQSGALLSLCWAKAHGMQLMVQDLTNPMLAQIPHVLLAAYADTIMGVETNAMQFYPEASAAEEKIHPGLYRRQSGKLDLSTIGGPGFGYQGATQAHTLPEPAVSIGMS